MKVDSALRDLPLALVAREAAQREELGYDGMWTAEAEHDAFLPIPLVTTATSRVSVGTGIAVAFARNPMNLAYLASDLQELARGRFVLGLGSQVKAHIVRRYSMPWSRPAARMAEMVSAIRAIWDSWESGSRLDFEGDFYSHTLMTPEFSPGPAPYGYPKIFVAAVGPRMLETAGRVADGVFLHSFTTERYLREVALPAIGRGLKSAGRAPADLEVAATPFVVTGSTEEEMAESREAVRRRIAFYGSTPAYRPVLDLHGWGALADELHAQSVAARTEPSRWDHLVNLVDDETLAEFVVAEEPGSVGPAVQDRFRGIADRIRLSRIGVASQDLAAIIAAIKSG